MSELLKKLQKNSTIAEASVLAKSALFENRDIASTNVPMMNVALGAHLNGGLTSGLTMFAGPSKHFKSAFSLLLVKAYMDKYPDAILLFYDSEFGTGGKDYFKSFKIDDNRVFHVPLENAEKFKFDIMAQLAEIKRGDKVVIFLDSLGNLPSIKEVDDALEGKGTADMTRAKQFKSIFRMLMPQLNIKDIPMIVVNHTYKEIGLYPKDIVSGGTGAYYSADNIYIVGRQQEKDGTEVVGWNFVLNVEKSRYVREKEKITITVLYDGGISKWSGLMEVALESGHVVKPKNGWYTRVDPDTGEANDKNWRLAETDCKEFWKPILDDQRFADFIVKKYKIAQGSILTDEDAEAAIEKEILNA